MATYNTQFNRDDSVIRHLIIGLLADLNKNVSFYRQLDNNTRVDVDVPFYYAITGDENFLKDNFLFSTANGTECSSEPEKADGNYDKVPRGVVNVSSMTVDPSKLINKRNPGIFQKVTDQGMMEGYRADFEMIPITVSVDIEIILSSLLDIFKCTEQLVKRLYKSNHYNVEVGHLNEGLYRIASYYALPDDFGKENPIEYSFDDKGQYKLSFSVEVNSSMPSLDHSTEKHVGNRIFNVEHRINDGNTVNQSSNQGLDT
jgi:hypothetical protein